MESRVALDTKGGTHVADTLTTCLHGGGGAEEEGVDGP